MAKKDGWLQWRIQDLKKGGGRPGFSGLAPRAKVVWVNFGQFRGFLKVFSENKEGARALCAPPPPHGVNAVGLPSSTLTQHYPGDGSLLVCE